jgi:hypothetical protein
MMKKTLLKKPLSLRAENLRSLTGVHLRDVIGGQAGSSVAPVCGCWPDPPPGGGA